MVPLSGHKRPLNWSKIKNIAFPKLIHPKKGIMKFLT